MKCFTWECGKLKEGLALTRDERLGSVVFLGEEGRGRHYEKVALDRYNPPHVDNGRVMNAETRKVTLPARDGKPEKVFFVLEKSAGFGADVLVRVKTFTSYVRNGQGGWRVSAGKPETIVSGYGAFGDAGRIGNWSDGLVAMRPGDVVQVTPTREVGGVSSFALWVDEAGVPQTATRGDYENLCALAETVARVAEVKAEDVGAALPLEFGLMPCLTYVGRDQFTRGIKVSTGITGQAVVLGEKGRGRRQAEVAIIGFTPGEEIAAAAVVKLSERTVSARNSWDPPVTQVIWGLTASECPETDAVMVRVKPTMGNRVHRSVKVNRGNPTRLASGVFAEGDAGNVGSTPDELWVLRSGESLIVGTYSNPSWVLECVGGGEISAQLQEEWEAADARKDPTPYLAKGWVPFGGFVPAEWVGRVVSVHRLRKGDGRVWLDQTYEGELISAGNGQIQLHLGWDRRDQRVVTVSSGLWIHLETEKTVTAPEPERETAKAEVTALQAAANEVHKSGYYKYLDIGLQALVSKVADGKESSDWSANFVEFFNIPTEEIQCWVAWAKDIISKVSAAEAAAKELERERAPREAVRARINELPNQYGYHIAHVAVREDGTVAVFCKKLSEEITPTLGEVQNWTLCPPEGEGSRWQPIPVEVRVTVRRVSWSGSLQYENAFTIPAGLRPGVYAVTNEGWLHSVVFWDGNNEVIPEQVTVVRAEASKPQPGHKSPANVAAPQESKPVDLSKVDLGALFGGNTRQRR